MRKTYLPLSDEDRNYLKSLSKKENHSGTSRIVPGFFLYKADGMTFQKLLINLQSALLRYAFVFRSFRKEVWIFAV